ncbi:MAG: NADAR family protein [Gammaproteobacteria bacterium]
MNKLPSSRRKGATSTEPASRALVSEIRFYRANEKPYGAFSNLFRRPMLFEGCEYPTAEHAYQAGKALEPEVRDWILSAPTPSLVAMAAHGLYTWDVVPNWSNIKFDRMRRVLRAKFTQHEDLKQLLLSTSEARLVEAGKIGNAVNRTWGEVNGKGLNMLGILLMEVRAELSKDAPVNNQMPRVAAGRKRTARRSVELLEIV